jgi:2-oxoglutarate ferredoxin oxidoreductase subunit alpha
VALEAMRLAAAEGLRVKVLVPKLLFPLSEQVYQEFFASVKRGLVVEQSHQGQLYRVIRMFVDVPKGLASLARSGSNPLSPGDVVERIKAQVKAMQTEYAPVQQVG